MKFATNLSKVLLVAFVAGNTLANYLLFSQIQELKKPAVPQTNTTVRLPEGEAVNLSAYATKEYVDEVAKGLRAPTPSPSAPTIQTTQTTSTPTKQISIIPISATFSTQSLDWVDVPNSDFYLDLVNDYSEDASVFWEAFIHEQHANGKAFARIIDVTHGIAVVGSEIETGSGTSVLVVSGNLAIWRGKNLYRVQLKSEKGFPVFFNSGRLKIID